MELLSHLLDGLSVLAGVYPIVIITVGVIIGILADRS